MSAYFALLVGLKMTLKKIERSLDRPGSEIVEGADGISGLPMRFKSKKVPKFRDGGLTFGLAEGQACFCYNCWLGC